MTRSTLTLGAIAAATVLATSTTYQSPPCDVFCHARLATRAEADGNYAEYQRQVRVIGSIAPSHPGVVYATARAFVYARKPDSALAALDVMARMGDTRDPNDDSLFNSVRRQPTYTASRNRLLANRLPILDGKVAFEIDDPDFTPEAIAYDSARSRFLAGSLSKRYIAAVTPNGTTTSFVPTAPEMLRVVGIHIDARRSRLWFATWAPAPPPDAGESSSNTRLFLADLATGRIVRSWTPDAGRRGHLLNDFVIMEDGGLFVTDTEAGSIYRLRSPADTLELFLQPDPNRLSTANGITSAPDGRTLYVAFVEGLARVDVASRTVALMPAADTASTAAIDGLYWYRGDLIAVQGLPTMARVVRYELSADGASITSAAVIERGHPIVQEPTTGVLVGSRFYYIANSQYGRLDERGTLDRRATPTRTAIRVIELEERRRR